MNGNENWIVCPLHGGLKYTKAALKTFLAQDCGDIRVLFIDNDSPDGTLAWLKRIAESDPAVEFEAFSPQLGVAGGWNHGLRRAWESGAEHALVVNNDVILPPDVYRRLLEHGGPFVTATNFPDQEEDQVPNPDFSCYLMRKEVWDTAGPFDERIWPAFFEDNDYHCRMHLAGIAAWRLKVPFKHIGSPNSRKGVDPGWRKIQERAAQNGYYFRRKWGFTPTSRAYEAFFATPRAQVRVERREAPRLLWIGDAGCPTGFATVTREILSRLRGWDIRILGINYKGDPADPAQWPWPMHPAQRMGDADQHGRHRFEGIVRDLTPDAVIVNNDPWIVADFARLNAERNIGAPLACYMPVDAEAQPADWARAIEGRVDSVIHYTEWGRDRFAEAGAPSSAGWLYHGVDRGLFRPMDKREARRKRGLGQIEDAFILGNVNVNSSRKRLDLTIFAFYLWLSRTRVENAYLYLHTMAGTDVLAHLAANWERHFRIRPTGRLVVLGDEVRAAGGVNRESMPEVYNCFDAQITTTMGEGIGLTQLEGAACGVPQIVPRFGALAEWMGDAPLYMEMADPTLPSHYPTLMYPPDATSAAKQIGALYRSPELRREIGQACLNLSRRPEFDWDVIAARFDDILWELVNRRGWFERPERKEEAAA